MRNLGEYFENRTIDYKKLLDYGFTKKEKSYIFEKEMNDDHFKIIVEFSKEKSTSQVVDRETDEEYVLVDVKNSSGEFVGKIKEEYEDILKDILLRCTDSNIFKSEQAKLVIEYIKQKYGDNLEYLWDKFPNNAIWRNKKNGKWYGLLVELAENKLGIESDRVIVIIDLRYQKEDIKKIIDNKKVFPGYHMNKNNWITIKLDGSIDTKKICKLVDNSFDLSLKK